MRGKMLTDKKKAYMKLYNQRNKEKIALQQKKRNLEYRLKNKELLKANKRKYAELNREKIEKYMKEYSKIYRNNREFGGNRIKVLERDKYTCQDCGKTHHETVLHIHHIDGTGRRKPHHNNKMNNLITLCNNCHTRHHAKNQKKQS